MSACVREACACRRAARTRLDAEEHIHHALVAQLRLGVQKQDFLPLRNHAATLSVFTLLRSGRGVAN
jgi:hypothetical protein